jgi:hypothetical protein
VLDLIVTVPHILKSAIRSIIIYYVQGFIYFYTPAVLQSRSFEFHHVFHPVQWFNSIPRQPVAGQRLFCEMWLLFCRIVYEIIEYVEPAAQYLKIKQPQKIVIPYIIVQKEHCISGIHIQWAASFVLTNNKEHYKLITIAVDNTVWLLLL